MRPACAGGRRRPRRGFWSGRLLAASLGLVVIVAGAGAAPPVREAATSTAARPAAGDPGTSPALRRAGLVPVRAFAPSIRLDIRYSTRRNFTGAVLPGYCRPWALLRGGAGRALARVQRRLARRGLGLLVFDAYRPARASRAMVRWAVRTRRRWVLRRGYVARRSNHNLGTAVDLTLIRLRTGRPLDMGTRYDSFTPRSSTLNARGAVLRNRLALRRAMAAEGFTNYRREWWHYDFRRRGPRRLDVTLGC